MPDTRPDGDLPMKPQPMAHTSSKVVALQEFLPPPSIEETACAWFARLRAANVTVAERAAFAEWLTLDREHARAFDHLLAMWELADTSANADDAQANARLSLWPILSAAGVLILGVLLAVALIA